MKPNPGKCKDCRFDNPQMFWVKQKVWEEAGLKEYWDGRFCLACFAKRLNRSLTPDDFDDRGPCSNDAIKLMYDLGDARLRLLTDKLAEYLEIAIFENHGREVMGGEKETLKAYYDAIGGKPNSMWSGD